MSERGKIAKDLRALIPQMEEDARCHRTWETPAAQAGMAKPSEKPLAEWVGDAEWHRHWAEFYERVATVMAAAADQLEERAVRRGMAPWAALEKAHDVVRQKRRLRRLRPTDRSGP